MSNKLPGGRTKEQCWKYVIQHGDGQEFTSWEPTGCKLSLDFCSELLVYVPQGRGSCAGKHSLGGVFRNTRSSEEGSCGRTEGLRTSADQTLSIWRLSGILGGGGGLMMPSVTTYVR